MKEFLKKYWIAITTIPLILVGTYLWFIAQGIFPTGDSLTKSDWLAFWGGFLSFSGSVVLGVVAVWQNSKANETNEKMLKETQRLGQVEFENDIKRDQYIRVINGTQQIGKKVSDICIQLSNVNIELRKEPSARFAADLLTPIITSIMLLRKMEIDNSIPIGYDDEFPIIQKNRGIIKDILQKNEEKMTFDREKLKKQDGKVSGEYTISVTITDISTALSEIISYFNSQLDIIDSYRSFVEEDTDE